MEILIDIVGKTELIYDFPNEKWNIVRDRETNNIREFCNNREMIIWLLDSIDKECEVWFVNEIQEPSKWLNICSGKLLAVTASSYPELEMEKVFEINLEKGWYSISKGSIDKITLALHKVPPIPPFDNIQES